MKVGQGKILLWNQVELRSIFRFRHQVETAGLIPVGCRKASMFVVITRDHWPIHRPPLITEGLSSTSAWMYGHNLHSGWLSTVECVWLSSELGHNFTIHQGGDCWAKEKCQQSSGIPNNCRCRLKFSTMSLTAEYKVAADQQETKSLKVRTILIGYWKTFDT